MDLAPKQTFCCLAPPAPNTPPPSCRQDSDRAEPVGTGPLAQCWEERQAGHLESPPDVLGRHFLGWDRSLERGWFLLKPVAKAILCLGFRVDSGRFCMTLTSKYCRLGGSAPRACSRGPGGRKGPREAEEMDARQEALTSELAAHSGLQPSTRPDPPQLLLLLVGSLSRPTAQWKGWRPRGQRAPGPRKHPHADPRGRRREASRHPRTSGGKVTSGP